MNWNDVLSVFLTELLKAVLPLAAAALAAWLFGLAAVAWKKFHEEHYDLAETIEQVAAMVVKAAEQSQLSGLIQDKKEFAIAEVERILRDQYKLKIDLATIDTLVEAAVWQEFNKAREYKYGLGAREEC